MGLLSVAELDILDWIAQNLRSDGMDLFMSGITRLGDSGIIWILLGAALLLLDKRGRSRGGQVLLSLVFSLIFCNLILKNAVGRIRPFELNSAAEVFIARPTDPSFPSGHSSASFAAVMVLMLTNWKGKWAAFALAVLIAFSRLYLYVHFPTDVLCGIALGLFCGWLSVTVWTKLQNKRTSQIEKNKL